jgi:hypothetical protein
LPTAGSEPGDKLYNPRCADVAQLVEHQLPKLRVAGSNPVVRSLVRLLVRLKERRRRKAHERHLAERARQQALSAQDAQQAVRNLARNSAGQDSTFSHGP